MEASAEGACVRWAVNTAKWQPEGDEAGDEFQFLLGLLPLAERESVVKFHFLDDKKRALVSRLLQRRCCELSTGVAWDGVQIARTKGSKPFMRNKPYMPHAPNFNFNVSHEGDWVVIASEPLCVVGLDVAAPGHLRRGRQQCLSEVLESFREILTAYEFGILHAQPDDRLKEEVFRRHWSMKESYVKARGDGLSFELGRCEFHPAGDEPFAGAASVYVDGSPARRWRFHLQRFGPPSEEHHGGSHWITTARGPVEDVVDAHGHFKAGLRKQSFTPDEWEAAAGAPHPPFSLVTVHDLVPDAMKELHEAAGGDAI